MAIEDEGLKRRIAEARVNGTVLDGANGASTLGLTPVSTLAVIPEEAGQKALDLNADVADDNADAKAVDKRNKEAEKAAAAPMLVSVAPPDQKVPTTTTKVGGPVPVVTDSESDKAKKAASERASESRTSESKTASERASESKGA